MAWYTVHNFLKYLRKQLIVNLSHAMALVLKFYDGQGKCLSSDLY